MSKRRFKKIVEGVRCNGVEFSDVGCVEVVEEDDDDGVDIDEEEEGGGFSHTEKIVLIVAVILFAVFLAVLAFRLCQITAYKLRLMFRKPPEGVEGENNVASFVYYMTINYLVVPIRS